MKLCGSGDCQCILTSGNRHFHFRGGSGGEDGPIAADWILYPRGRSPSISAAGTRYYLDGTKKIFYRLPVLMRRRSLRQQWLANRVTWWTGLDAITNEPPPGVGLLTTDPEFESIFDADAAAAGIVRFSSDYDNYRMLFQPFGVMMAEGSKENGAPGITSGYDARNLTIRPHVPAGYDSTADIRVPLHHHGATRSTIHGSKMMCVRLPKHVLTGNSWSFLVQIINNPGVFLSGEFSSRIWLQIYGHWTAIPV